MSGDKAIHNIPFLDIEEERTVNAVKEGVLNARKHIKYIKHIKTPIQDWERRFNQKYHETVGKIMGDCNYWDGFVDEEKEKESLKSFIREELSHQRKETLQKLRLWTNGRTVTKDSLRAKLNEMKKGLG